MIYFGISKVIDSKNREVIHSGWGKMRELICDCLFMTKLHLIQLMHTFSQRDIEIYKLQEGK